MREIKFRAWDRQYKKMIGWEELRLEHGWDRHPDYDLMEFTGLHDRNGKEIYEGDILEWMSHRLPITVDDFHGFRFMCGKDQLTKAYALQGQVIGSIHQHPGLVGGGGV